MRQFSTAVFAIAAAVHSGFARADEAAADPSSAPGAVAGIPSPSSLELSNSLSKYQEEIRRAEAEGGPFDPRLGESLLSLGLIQRANGDHAAAVEVLERALHIKRVTEGLYNMGQEPLIELLIESHTALGRTEDLDRHYQLLYWLHKRNYGSDDALLAGIIDRIGRWRLDAFKASPVARSLGHAIQADNLYDVALERLDDDAQSRPALINALYQRALANYYLASTAADTSQSFNDVRKALGENGRGVFEIDDTEARFVLFQETFLKGEVAVKRLLKLTGEDPGNAVARAEALVFAGDWYLTFRRVWDAMQHYKEAWRLLQENGAPPDQIRRLFDAPKSIEPITTPTGEAEAVQPKGAWVEAIFDVSEAGWPENIRIQSTHPDDDARLVQRGEVAVAGVRHRPRFENGEPVATKDVTLRYIFKK